MSFTNKVVLITGAAEGIGAATAIGFAREAAYIAIVDINEARLSVTAAECEKVGKKPLIIIADVTKDAKRIIDETVAAFEKLDVLINNAGIFKFGCISDGNLIKAFDGLVDTNLRSVMNLTMLAAPYVKTTKGNIINIASVGACKPPSVLSHIPYCVIKAAVKHFTKAAAIELAPFGVRVNCISPGPVRTRILEKIDTTSTLKWDDFKAVTALQRISEPEEIGELLLFLASDNAKSITGSNYVIDNGYLLN